MSSMSRKRWQIKPVPSDAVVADLARQLNGLHPALARTLAARGIDTFDSARHYFRAGISDLHDPFLMRDMDLAVDRLVRAIENDERILVYGDYDVDGTTATALLTRYLRDVGGDVCYFIPDRFKHGYGLSVKGLDHAVEEGAKVVVALDCGVTAVEEALYARKVGLDLVICDHHTPQAVLPDAIAVVDPKRADCDYPFKELCACAVAFKLAQAMETRLQRSRTPLTDFLDLVALATASDVVSVTGENRILLREGLERLRTNARVGLKMLAEEAGVRMSDCSASNIIFALGPRINAAGRLGDASRAVALMLAFDELEAVARARQLERLNQERRELDQETQELAFAKADRLLAKGSRHTIVLHDEDWHLGVIGIVASRLVERHYRPTIMMTTLNGMAKGSARSVAGINIYAALQECEDLLTEFGGHDFAAGVTLPIAHLTEFANRFEQAVSGAITADVLEPVVHVDAELALKDVNAKFWNILRQFAPFGADNEMPIFQSSNLEVVGPISTVGKDRSHLRFAVMDRDGGQRRDVIGFRMAKYLDVVTESQATGQPLEMLHSIQENTWNGRTKLQLQAVDIRLG
jgi:single-stranded-DNA-specific exonuclease